MIPKDARYVPERWSDAPADRPVGLTPRERAVNWLRWGAILPAAIVAALLATGAINILVAQVQSRQDGDSTVWNLASAHVLKQLAQAFFLPMAAIWAGTMTAPAYRNYVIVSLATLWSVVLVIAYAIIGAASFQNEAPVTWWLMFAASVALNVAGIISVLVEYRTIHMNELSPQFSAR